MDDAEVIIFARTEIDKVRHHGGRRVKDKSGQEYVLLELEIAERLLALAQERIAERGHPEP
jgi:anthranilate phosphoribosyltransferase